MNALDKRIGNYVHYYPGFDSPQHKQPRFLAKIANLSEAGVYSYAILEKHPDAYHNNIEEIKLTEEWLLKLGGEKDENGDVFLCIDKENDLRIYLKKGHALLCKGDCCPLYEYEHIDEVHLFQNLVFALTGEELTIKEETK